MTKAGVVNTTSTSINQVPVLDVLPSKRTIGNNRPLLLSDAEVIAIANKVREILKKEGEFRIPEKIGDSYCFLTGNLRPLGKNERAFTLQRFSGISVSVQRQMSSGLKDVEVLDWTSDQLISYVDKVEEKISNQDLNEAPSLENSTQHKVAHLAFKYLLQQRKVVFESSTLNTGTGLKQSGPDALNNWLNSKKTTLEEFSSRWQNLPILNQRATITDLAPADEQVNEEEQQERLDTRPSLAFQEVPPSGSSVMEEPVQVESSDLVKEAVVLESNEEVVSPLEERVELKTDLTKKGIDASSQTDLTKKEMDGLLKTAERRKFVICSADSFIVNSTVQKIALGALVGFAASYLEQNPFSAFGSGIIGGIVGAAL